MSLLLVVASDTNIGSYDSKTFLKYTISAFDRLLHVPWLQHRIQKDTRWQPGNTARLESNCCLFGAYTYYPPCRIFCMVVPILCKVFKWPQILVPSQVPTGGGPWDVVTTYSWLPIILMLPRTGLT